jgi:REP element-mobilizing transposase RayT
MDRHNRKPTRIPNYDYSRNNYYFVTLCAHERKCIFGSPNCLSLLGKIAERDLNDIGKHFPTVSIDKYVVMPNHIHAIVVIDNGIDAENKTSLINIVGQYKAGVSRKIHTLCDIQLIWQRSFHDRVIRNQKEYEKIWMYIETNPLRWNKDCFYTEES